MPTRGIALSLFFALGQRVTNQLNDYFILRVRSFIWRHLCISGTENHPKTKLFYSLSIENANHLKNDECSFATKKRTFFFGFLFQACKLSCFRGDFHVFIKLSPAFQLHPNPSSTRRVKFCCPARSGPFPSATAWSGLRSNLSGV